MYELEKPQPDVTVLVRVAKSGRKTNILTVHGVDDNRLLVIDKLKARGLRFKSDQPVKLKSSGHVFIAKVSGALQVFALPHFITYHNEVMKCNSAMLHSSTAKNINPDYIDHMSLDYDTLLDNMLEFVSNV